MKLVHALAVALVATLLAAPLAEAEENETDWAKLLEAKAASIVNIKFVLKIQVSGMGRTMPEQEGNIEARGALVNARGLIVTALAHFDPARSVQFPPAMRGQVTVKGSHSDLKVLFGNEEEEYEAQIVARDSDLGLAFLQILGLGDREVTPLDLTAGAGIAVGQTVFGVSRLPRGFDCAPILRRLFVSAKVEKPRKMWAFAGAFEEAGLPVFDLSGAPVGILSQQGGSEGADAQMATLPHLILPLDSIARSLKMANERATEALEAAKEAERGPEEKADKPAEEAPDEPSEEKPAEDKPAEDAPDQPGADK